MASFKKRCDDRNKEHDERTGGAKVVTKPEPKWKSGPLADDGKEWDYVLTFGKHKGKMLSEVETSYLQWMLGESDLFQSLRQKVVREYVRRHAGVVKEDSGRETGSKALGSRPEISPDRPGPPW